MNALTPDVPMKQIETRLERLSIEFIKPPTGPVIDESALLPEYLTRIDAFRGYGPIAPILHLLPGRGWIAGSYAASMISNQSVPPGDIDIFTVSIDAARDLIVALLKRPRAYANPMRYFHNGVCESLDKSETRLTYNVQVLLPNPRWACFPLDIINDFDLNVSRALLQWDAKTVIADTDAGMLYGKVLRINDPIRTFKRLIKYMQRGVRFNDHELLKVFSAWQAMSEDRRAQILDDARIAAAPPDDDDQPDSSFFSDDDDDFYRAE